jgi:ssDNA-specific exonuclease RecJ
MNICYNNIHKKKETNIRKKRQEISKSATRGLNSNNIKVLIDFN